MTPFEIAECLELQYSDYSWGYTFRFTRTVDMEAFMDLCDEQGSYAIIPHTQYSDRWVAWYCEEGEA